ncbi:MAG: phenylalanine--tRNA ligase subunit beta, partial [Firmicutes bacterium]|nr:phenylalanine--tRNA ligase subunit beta [Bacillota bacterium]
ETDEMHRNFVRIINPLGEENSVMRTMLIPNMMDVLQKNNAQGNKEVGMFEIGRIFNDSSINCDGQPVEAEDLCIAFYGGTGDFYTLKGYVQGLLEELGITDVEFVAEKKLPTYHPGRCANIISGGELLGTMGEIRPDVSERYGIDSEVYAAELFFSVVMRQTVTEFVYSPLPKYPAVTRDIAVLVAEEVTIAQLEKVIMEQGGSILESVSLFDVYRGKQIADGMKSVAFALVYRDPDRTLTDEEVREKQEKVIAGLESEFGAELRKM